MALELWTTAELFELITDNRILPPTGFWSGVNANIGLGGAASPNGNGQQANFTSLNVFTREHYSDREKIYFDELPIIDRRLAPFVAPNVQGRVMADRGRAMSSFKPAYVKPKHVVDPSKAIPRMAGEPLGGSMTLEQRFDARVAVNLRDERDMIYRRWDWLACRALVDGRVVIAGEDYPAVTVDFKRDPSLNITLAGGALWDAVGSKPFLDIRDARAQAFLLGRSPVSRLVFGQDAWTAFSDNADVRRALDKFNAGNNSLFNNINIGQDSPAEYVGRIAGPTGGGIDMWVYSNQYEDEDGTMQDYLDPRDVVGVGNNVQGVRAFGAIMDRRAGLQAVSMFPKMWDEEDPSVTYTLTQSAPLMVPGVPNNTFKMRCLA